MQNPFFGKKYNTPYETPPFDKILFEHYEPAMMEGMRLEKVAIEALCNNPEEPTFENTILPKTGEMLENVTSVFFNLLSACNSPEMEELSQKMSPLLSEHSNSIMMNEKLFLRIKHVWEKRHELDTEQQILMDKIYDGFLRTGANLPKEKKEELAQLRTQLSQLSLQFSQNELHDTNAWTMHLTDEDDLLGLPESAIVAARQEAENRGLEGWIITLQAPSYGPFMQYSQRRDLREKVYRAMNSICTHDNENNNFENVRSIVNLRQKLAQVMGYKNYADFVLERRMAQDTEHVTDLMEKLLKSYRPVALKEVEEIEQLAKEKEGEDFTLQPWDFSHYGYLLKMQRYNIDSEMLRPYASCMHIVADRPIFGAERAALLIKVRRIRFCVGAKCVKISRNSLVAADKQPAARTFFRSEIASLRDVRIVQVQFLRTPDSEIGFSSAAEFPSAFIANFVECERRQIQMRKAHRKIFVHAVDRRQGVVLLFDCRHIAAAVPVTGTHDAAVVRAARMAEEDICRTAE